MSYMYNGKDSRQHLRMTSGRDEVEEGMHPVVAEARVTLDTRLLSKNVVVLTLEVANDLLEAFHRDLRVSA